MGEAIMAAMGMRAEPADGKLPADDEMDATVAFGAMGAVIGCIAMASDSPEEVLRAIVMVARRTMRDLRWANGK